MGTTRERSYPGMRASLDGVNSTWISAYGVSNCTNCPRRGEGGKEGGKYQVWRKIIRIEFPSRRRHDAFAGRGRSSRFTLNPYVTETPVKRSKRSTRRPPLKPPWGIDRYAIFRNFSPGAFLQTPTGTRIDPRTSI